MSRALRGLGFAAALTMTATSTAHAAPVSYSYDLQPGTLSFTINEATLTSQGFGTFSPIVGLLGLTLQLDGLSFEASSDAFYPSDPYLTLTKNRVTDIVFDPVGTAGTYDFSGQSGVGGASDSFAYVLTRPDQTVLSGTARLAASAVPEPASMALLAAGLLGLAGVRRRRRA